MKINADDLGLSKAAESLLSGSLVIVPTDTVYGLAACVDQSAAITKIFEEKGRPQDRPLSCLFASWVMAQTYVKDISPEAEFLAEKFFPGPITLILNKTDLISDQITAGQSSVGVRVPDCDALLKLISKVNKPLAAPSANYFQNPPPVSGDEADQNFLGRILTLDIGSTKQGLESTIVDCSKDTIKILREGAISRDVIFSTLSERFNNVAIAR